MTLSRPCRRLIALLAHIALLSCASHVAADTQSVQSGRWSDPATWSTGWLPEASDAVTISAGDTVVYDLSSARAAGVTVEDGATLAFHPEMDVTLETDENVLVLGRLEMRPKAPDNDAWRNSVDSWRPYFMHTLRFVDVDERAFVGGGMDPLASDVGLWVQGDGVLDIAGAQKTGWSRLAGAASAGDTSITLEAAPIGWRVGDRIAVTPTGPIRRVSNYDGSWLHFDERTITAINGAAIRLDAALTYNHPVVTGYRGTYTAEVLNVSRNVRIEGTGSNSLTPASRAHIFIRSSSLQSIKYAELILLGPRQNTSDGKTGIVQGRYPLHFHHSGDGSRGSIVEGVVANRVGSHSFVPHVSHGITFLDTVAYDVLEDAYWWDPGELSNDITYDRAVAALVQTHPGRVAKHSSSYRLTGFNLAGGTGNVTRNSVAVGVNGGHGSSGFHWPESANQRPNVWIFENNLTHNNNVSGIFIWQNCTFSECEGPHILDGVVAYRNGGSKDGANGIGILAGAYLNAYQFHNMDVFDNGRFGIEPHARSLTDAHLQRPDGYVGVFTDFDTDSMQIPSHNVAALIPTLFKDCTIDNGLTGREPGKDSLFDFVNCGLEPSDFNILDMSAGSVWRVQRADCTAFQINGPEPGAVTTINPFYTCGTPPPADTEPPSAPLGLTATAVSSTQVDLSWTASTDNVGVSGYRLYRDGSLVTTASGTNHSDTGLTADTTYAYEIAAIDAAGSESDRSPPAEARTLPDDPDPGYPGDPVAAWDGPQSFKGTSDFVSLGAIDVPGSAITIAARFTADTFACSDCPSRDGRLVSKASGSQTDDHYWMLSTIKAGSSNRLRLRLKTNGSTSTLVAGSGNLQPAVSYHAAAVYDGAQMRLYLDGALVGSQAKSGSIDTNSAVPAWIGANPDRHRWWDGTISDVRIYDRALSASEIAALQAGG